MERDPIQGEAFDNFPGYIDKEGVKKRIEQSGLTFSEDGGNASDDSSDSSSSDESVDEVIDKPLQHNKKHTNGRQAATFINIEKQRCFT